MARLLKLVLVNLLLLIAGLALIELGFGGFLRDDPLAKLNLVRDRTVRYDLNGIYESATGHAVYTRDRWGLRGDYPAPDRIDILTVGGSAVDQRFVSDAETFEARMQARWHEAGHEVTVVNAGVDGQSTLGHLKNFEWWFPHVPELEPRFILFYIGVNDLFGNVGTVWDALEDASARAQTLPWEEREQLPDLLEDPADRTLLERWRDDSALYYLWRTVRGAARARTVRLQHGRGFLRDAETHWTSERRLQDHRAVIADDLVGYGQRVRALIAATRAMGARPIIVTQSAHYFIEDQAGLRGFSDGGFFFKGQEVLGTDIHRFLQLYGEVALATCREEPSCIPVDLLGELPFEVGDFYDNVHNTPRGARKIAAFLVEALSPQVLVESG